MGDSKDDNLVEIRTFATMQEIENLEGFKDDNPVSEKNYERIIGDYNFKNKVKCCREKPNKELCGTGHQWGFVARLKDKSVSIVGNHCAINKFGADASIKADRSRYVNAKKRRDGLSRLNDLLKDKESIMTSLESISSQVKELQSEVEIFSKNIGNLTLKWLEDASRTNNSSININLVNTIEYVDEEGKNKIERNVTTTRLGSLNGLSIFNNYTFHRIKTEIRHVKLAFSKAESFPEDSKISEIEALASEMDSVDSIVENLKKVNREKNDFFKNELSLLCFITSNKAERYKNAKYVLELSGESAGKEKAKNWLHDHELAIRTSMKADKIEILG